MVCTECRRRKIACDRNTPCIQCIQSNSACTYYHSHSSTQSGDLSGDHDGARLHDHHDGGVIWSAAANQPANGFGPKLWSTPTTTTNRHNAFSSSKTNTSNTIPSMATTYPDVGAINWFDTAGLGATTSPLHLAMDTHNMIFPILSTAVPLDTDDETFKMDSFVPNTAQSAQFVFHKSRLHGPSHWLTLLQKCKPLGLFDDINSAVFNGEGQIVLQKCKRLARALKSKSAPDPQLLSRSLRTFIPPKEISDKLLQLYLQTFEPVLRVLHVPTLEHEYAQYWSNPHGASELFVLQLLLIMAIGTCFYHDVSPSEGPDGSPTLHDQSMQWIYCAHMRIAAPFRKRHLNLAGVQAQCLLVLALWTNNMAVGGDTAWITTASLVQSSMAIGLHLKPSQLPVSPFEAEVRRRLWATILELAVQASLDSGVQPIVSAEALGTYEFPSNLDDSQISESSEALPSAHPASTLTQSSIQRALLRSLSVRFRVAEILSQSRDDEISYDMARAMGAELTAALRETSEKIDMFHPTQPSAFHIQLQDLLVRRFLLVLHMQFAHKACSDVKYYYSRAVSLECSLLLLAPSRSNGSGGGTSRGHDDFTSLRVYGDGLFKSVFLTAALTVCTEFLLQLRESSSPAGASLMRRELLQVVEDAAALTRRRILRGETSVKMHAFLVCVLAHVGTYRNRPRLVQKAQQTVADAAKHALDCCYDMLEARLGRMVAQKIPVLGLGVVTVPSKSHARLELLESLVSGLDKENVAVATLDSASYASLSSLDDGSDTWSFTT